MKIIITGPESSGKSTLSAKLSTHFDIPLVKEFSRIYLNRLHRPYDANDLIEMAKGQNQAEIEAQLKSEYVICDTSLEVYKIWHEYRFGPCPEELNELIGFNSKNFYLLLTPNIPWKPDPLRENPQDRDKLFILYKDLLLEKDMDFKIIDGLHGDRTQQAIEIINPYVLNN